MVCLFYYCHTRHAIELSYYMVFFYLTGNLVFATVLYLLVLMVFDRGPYALTTMESEIALAE